VRQCSVCVVAKLAGCTGGPAMVGSESSLAREEGSGGQ
jgi:hypothetical protein